MLNYLRFALLTALISGFALGVPAQTSAEKSPSNSANAAPVALDQFEVTGSRIKRAEFEGPTPVLQITSEDIKISGYKSVDEYLRQLPMVSGYSADASGVTTFTPGVTAINLRNLGGSAGLILVNGRRSAPYGQSGASVLFYDVGVLPAAAIESVEYLKDGGSALYGADAVSGVLNFKIKRNYVGTSLRTQYTQTEKNDHSYRSLAFTHGRSSAQGSLLFSFEGSQNNAIAFSDRPVSHTEDQRAFDGYDYRYPVSFPASLVVPSGATGVPAALTGRIIAPGIAKSAGTVQFVTTATPRVAQFVALPSPVAATGLPVSGDTRNGLDRAPYSSLVPKQRDLSLTLMTERHLLPRLSIFGDFTYRRRVAATFYEPSTISLTGETGFGDLPDKRMVFPASNPYNPFGVDITDMAFYLPESGRRDNQITTEVPRGVAGLRGRFGDSWDWEVAGLATRNRVFSRWNNFLSDQKLQDALSGRLGGYLNPFGPSDPGVVAKMRTDLTDLQYSQLLMADAHATGKLGRWWGGEAALAVGAETREDSYQHYPRELRTNGGLVSLAKRVRRDLHRTVSASYAEFSVPFGPKVELQLAGRWERYTDFGHSVKPKAAIALRPVKGLLVRASASQSFRAPELLQLYSDALETFTQERDPRRPDLGVYTMRVVSGGNRALKPEITNSTYAGVVWDVPVLPGLQLGADVWRFAQHDLIGALGGGVILRNEAGFGAARITRTPSPAPGVPGEVVVINDTFGNYNRYTTQGWDFDLSYRWSSSTWGTWRLRSMATLVRAGRYANNDGSSGDDIGRGRRPDLNWNAALSWGRAGWDVALFANRKGRNQSGYSPVFGGFMAPALVFLNTHVGYSWSKGRRLELGVTNLQNINPPRNYDIRTGYSNGFYDNLGRTYTLAFEQSL